jgi:hypothetical protein
VQNPIVIINIFFVKSWIIPLFEIPLGLIAGIYFYLKWTFGPPEVFPDLTWFGGWLRDCILGTGSILRKCLLQKIQNKNVASHSFSNI